MGEVIHVNFGERQAAHHKITEDQTVLHEVTTINPVLCKAAIAIIEARDASEEMAAALAAGQPSLDLQEALTAKVNAEEEALATLMPHERGLVFSMAESCLQHTVSPNPSA